MLIKYFAMLSFEGADIIDTYQKSVRYVSFKKKKKGEQL